ncbi:hypothetical protein BIV57_13070 [Mangrovactinospora gilvigrisea]|uniref:Secreted protein/lipoprotein n=1 Tax=Mangrovactinospora gilvigrisea TaxID=1428644 RepID=A0A1J7BEG4_9ACTN|nr:hypothetical protein [Mangrovactinospora gilvigrisea]OIV37087.1 hypothetical protein BIV57_13070 [Mangrovactinospora gilvigrisea]
MESALCRGRAARWSSTAICAAALALGTTACGSHHVDQLSGGKSSDAQKVAHASASPTDTDSPAVAKAKVAALAAYRDYWTTRNAAMASGNPNDTAPDKYTIDKAIGELYGTLVQMKHMGMVSRGGPVLNPTATSVALNSPPSKPSMVSIHDCLDFRNYKVISSASGKQVKPKKQILRYQADATVRTVGSDWRVSTMTFHQDQPC